MKHAALSERRWMHLTLVSVLQQEWTRIAAAKLETGTPPNGNRLTGVACGGACASGGCSSLVLAADRIWDQHGKVSRRAWVESRN